MTADPTSLTGTAVRDIADLATAAAAPQTVSLGEYQFAAKTLTRISTDPALPRTLEFYTLDGFAKYLEEEDEPDTFVHVVSPTRVDAVSKLEGADRHQRRVIASAACKTAELRGFAFNDEVTLETLAIALQTCFEMTDDLLALRKFCASVRSTATVGTDDDGISQTVEARRGIAAVQTAAVKNPWLLAPWRTFAEITQPISPFVLRFQQGEPPEAALYETG